jgi:hypothetical protein
MRFRPELLILLLIVAFLAVMISLSHRDDLDIGQTVAGGVVHSSYRTFPEGYKALYLTLDRLGYDVQRQVRFYGQLPRRGLLIVADPHRRKITDYEKGELEKWIAAGNHALIAVEHHTEGLLEGGEYQPRPPAILSGLPGMTPVTRSSIEDIQEGLSVGTAVPLAESFLSPRVKTFAAKTCYRFSPDKSPQVMLFDKQVGTAYLYADEGGPVVAYSAIGKGGIFWCSSPWSFSNGGLREHGENLEFILALVGLQPGAPIIFDEYHHDFGAGATVWSVAPVLTKLGIVQVAIAFLLLLLTLAWRFGAVQLPLEERFSRSRAEYLTSMADLLNRVHATHVVLQRQRSRLGRALGRRFGLPVNAPLQQLVQANTAHPLVDPALLMRTCRELELLEQAPRPDEESMLHLARNVERLVSLRGKK